MENPLFDRDLSWLSFNERVLQEARNEQTPLFERLNFLAIYSANLDEFFRVRVAALRSFRALEKDTRKAMEVKPRKTLRLIRRIVQQQQEEFGRIFRQDILPDLDKHGIKLLVDHPYNEQQQTFARQYFEASVAAHINVNRLNVQDEAPFLENKALYLVVNFTDGSAPALVTIPSGVCPRFVAIPDQAPNVHVFGFLDDIIRCNLPDLFKRPIAAAYAIKLSRNAELPIDDEYSGDLLEKIKQGLEERHIGPPTRFLYDRSMPEELKAFLKKLFDLNKNDLIPGGRYHNFNDFFGFPKPGQQPSLEYEPMPPLPHPVLSGASSILAVMAAGDQIVHYPYQRFDYVIKLLKEAAQDPSVEQIKITLYRAASPSAIVEALLEARLQGKEVVVFIEAKARFDEAANLQWGEQLQAAGAQVFYSYPGIKVHAKLLLISRREKGKQIHYAYLSTGNFNEKTAKIYGDHALFTADPRLTHDTARLFDLLERKLLLPDCKHLIPAPFALRDRLKAMIRHETELAKAGKNAYIFLKMNSLEEADMIALLYEASQAGVKIRLIIRGICCLIPGVPGLSDHIEAISIVGRFLEHARVFIFGNDGQEQILLSSADWMKRNLHRRIEVAIPIYHESIRQQLRDIMELQWADHVKARQIDVAQSNTLRHDNKNATPLNSQISIYQYCQQTHVQ